MKIKKELITAVQLLLLLHLLYWSFTWNLPPDFDGNQKNEIVGKTAKTGPTIPLVLNKRAVLLETIKYVKQVKEAKSRFRSAMIPSFNEWKESEMMKQDKGRISNKNHHKRKRSRRKLNYASSKCGAKILSSNSEARHRLSILNEKADEYMLNPCRVKQWFVLELCDTIEITQIELANYELYSSSLKSFSVLWSDIYPTHSWRLLGSFVASNRRSMETFEIIPRNLGKFIKIIIFSHYGKEHYCTLSTVRVLGYSMMYGFEEADSTATETTVMDISSNTTTEELKQEKNSSFLVKNEAHNSSAVTLRQKNKTLTYVKMSHFMKRNVKKTYEISQHSRFLNLVYQKTSSNSDIYHKTNAGNYTDDNMSHTKNTISECFNNKSSSRDLFINAKDNVCSKSYESVKHNQSHSKNIDNRFVNQSKLPINESAQDDKLTEAIQSVDQIDTKTLKYEEFKRNYAKVEDIPPHKDVSCHCDNKISDAIESERTEKAFTSKQSAVGYESFEDSAALIQKESILVKLSSRIQSSEFNLSLINVYLQELSQSYKQQIEDMHSMFNETVKAITSASDKAVLIDNHQQKEIEHLEQKMTFLSNKAAHLLAEQSHMVRLVIELHAFFLILEFIIISTIFTIFMNNFKQTRHFHDKSHSQIRKYSNKYLSFTVQ
ncbi:SUN domain-containing ossification factor-like [Uloborus diversus]|uniref:SUN domain-containing ossification factor-like n=1 Tax=Uloborus diversus TaxID=327109 RepID=UPI002409F269|nr:SUN domain-containing ossification factor-like [Uloborus diversus]